MPINNAGNENIGGNSIVTGSVSIGGITPLTALDVSNSGVGGTQTGSLVTLRGGNSSSTFNSNQIILTYAGTNQYAHAIKTRHHSVDYVNAIDFYVWKYLTDSATTVGSQHVMTLIQGGVASADTGRVGIGTNAPTAKLEIASLANRNILLGNSVNNTNYNVISLTGTLADSGFVGFAGGATSDNSLYITAQNSLIFRPNGTTQRMVLNSSGYLTISNQPSFQAHRGGGANYTITNSSDTTVLPFNTVRHDTTSSYNTSNYRFTAPIAGKYLFTATVRWDGSSGGSYLRTFFTVNGSSGQGGSSFNYGHQIMGPSGYSSSYQSLTISAVINLASNDYVSVVGGINIGTTDMHAESQWSGQLLG